MSWMRFGGIARAAWAERQFIGVDLAMVKRRAKWALSWAMATTAYGQGAPQQMPGGPQPTWTWHGKLRGAVGLVDTSSKAGVSFATTDVVLATSGKVRDYTANIELRGTSSHADDETSSPLAAVDSAAISWDTKSLVRVDLGRMKLAGARRVGSELVMRNGDRRFGTVDGLRLAVGDAGYDVGLIGGNTQGSFGASSANAETSMAADMFSPAAIAAPKIGRALIAYATAAPMGVDLRLWVSQENNEFTAAPTVSADQVAAGTAPDGVAYKRTQRVDGSIGYSWDALTIGAWGQKVWLKDPRAASVKGNGALATANPPAGVATLWRELFGLGAIYDEGAAAAGSTPLAGISVVATRTGTSGLAKASAAAKAEEDSDMQQLALTAGIRDATVTATLNVALNNAKGDAFPNKDGEPRKEKKRVLVYTAMNFEL